jgi:PhnB protein
MSVQLNPYLSFRDNAREAMEFYRSVFGGELRVNTFKEYNASSGPSEDDLVMHAQLEGEHGVVFMGSDTPQRMEYKPGSNFSMSLSGDDDAVLRGWFQKLAYGGTVTMPLEKAMWGDTFGMVVDRYGVNWLVNISGSAA